MPKRPPRPAARGRRRPGVGKAAGRRSGSRPPQTGSGIGADVLAGVGILFVVLAAERHRLASRLHAVRSSVSAHTVALGAVVVLVLAGVVTLSALRTSRRRGATPGASRRFGRSAAGRRSPTAEPGWADRRDLRPLEVRNPPGDRIVLGSFGRRLLAAEAAQSVLVVGPTQSGKTSGLAVPAILEWAGSVVATSVKSDLVRATIDERGSLGPVHVYDPTGACGLPSEGWSPLATATTWAGARRLASALCSVARADGGMEDAGFWYASAEKLLAPLLLAAATAGVGMSEVVRWIDDEDLHEPMLALELTGVPDALRAARTSFGREERQRSSVFATAETILAGFADPGVASASTRDEIRPAGFVAGPPATLYCCAPAREQERLRPVFVALLRQVIDSAFETSSRSGRPLHPPLLLVLDEAANIAPLEDLDTVVSTAAGHGIQLLTVWQDFAQIEARFGRRWPTIVNNHRAKVLCPGNADPLTLDHLSSLIGDDERAEHSTTFGDDGRWSSTEAVSVRRVAPSAALRTLAPGDAVVVSGALPPARLRLRPYYERRTTPSKRWRVVRRVRLRPRSVAETGGLRPLPPASRYRRAAGRGESG